MPAEELRDFFLYVDEFPTLVSPSFADTMSESRKFRVSLITAMQDVEPIETNLRNALFENVGTPAVFCVGLTSARVLSPQLDAIEKEEFMSLPRYCFYMRMIYDGQPYPPFSATTLSPTSIRRQ